MTPTTTGVMSSLPPEFETLVGLEEFMAPEEDKLKDKLVMTLFELIILGVVVLETLDVWLVGVIMIIDELLGVATITFELWDPLWVLIITVEPLWVVANSDRVFEITIELIIEVAEISKLIELDIIVVIIDDLPLIAEDIVEVTRKLGGPIENTVKLLTVLMLSVGATLEVTAKLILEAEITKDIEISGELLGMMSEVV